MVSAVPSGYLCSEPSTAIFRTVASPVGLKNTEPASPLTATEAPPNPAKRTEIGKVVASGVGRDDCAAPLVAADIVRREQYAASRRLGIARQDKAAQRLLTIVGPPNTFGRDCRELARRGPFRHRWTGARGRSGKPLGRCADAGLGQPGSAGTDAAERQGALLQPQPPDTVAQGRDLRARTASRRDQARLRRRRGVVPGGADRARLPHWNPDLLLEGGSAGFFPTG